MSSYLFFGLIVAMAGTMVAFNPRGDHFIPPPVFQAVVLAGGRVGEVALEGEEPSSICSFGLEAAG